MADPDPNIGGQRPLSVEIAVLRPEEWELLREIRLEALEDSPYAYGQSLSEAALMSEQDWRTRLEKSVHTVARIGDRIVALVAIRKETHEKVAHIAHINAMYVKPEARGQGVGKLLLQIAMDAAIERGGITKFKLNVTEGNESAAALYLGLGFRVVGTLEKEILQDGKYLNDILMEKVVA